MEASQVALCPLRNPVSSATHLFWCVGAFFVTALLWRLTSGDWSRRWSVSIFGASMCFLYAASGVYHAVRCDQGLLHVFRLIDHSAIYVLIAGTSTPVFTVLLSGRLRVALLALVWGLAGLGIAAKWLVAAPPYPVTVGLYVALGLVGLLPIVQLIQTIGLGGVAWALVGGVLYIAGGVCDAVRWPVLIPNIVGPHEVVHVLDMGGTLAHVFLVIRYVIPFGR